VPIEFLRNTNYIGTYTKYYFLALVCSVCSFSNFLLLEKKFQAEDNTKMESAQIKYEIIFFISVVSAKQQ